MRREDRAFTYRSGDKRNLAKDVIECGFRNIAPKQRVLLRLRHGFEDFVESRSAAFILPFADEHEGGTALLQLHRHGRSRIGQGSNATDDRARWDGAAIWRAVVQADIAGNH